MAAIPIIRGGRYPKVAALTAGPRPLPTASREQPSSEGDGFTSPGIDAGAGNRALPIPGRGALRGVRQYPPHKRRPKAGAPLKVNGARHPARAPQKLLSKAAAYFSVRMNATRPST